MQKRPRKASSCLVVWVAIEIFRLAIELLALCRDMVLRLQAVAGSQQGSPWCRDNVLFSVVTMSRYRFPCRDRDGHDKRSELQRSRTR